MERIISPKKIYQNIKTFINWQSYVPFELLGSRVPVVTKGYD